MDITDNPGMCFCLFVLLLYSLMMDREKRREWQPMQGIFSHGDPVDREHGGLQRMGHKS